MKKRRCTKALVERIRNTTNLCHSYATNIVFERNRDKLSADVSLVDFRIYIDSWNVGFWQSRRAEIKKRYENFELLVDEVNDEYLVQLCQLGTETLEDILLAHDRGKFMRAPRTIAHIKTELATRGLLL